MLLYTRTIIIHTLSMPVVRMRALAGVITLGVYLLKNRTSQGLSLLDGMSLVLGNCQM